MTPPAFSPSSLALWDELDHHKFRDEKAVVADNLARVPLDAAERAAVVAEAVRARGDERHDTQHVEHLVIPQQCHDAAASRCRLWLELT